MHVSFVKGVGTAFLNAVRAESFIKQDVLRPIGFKVGDTSTIIDTPENVLEDMTTFISNVDVFNFCATQNKDLIIAQCQCNGVLSMRGLLDGTGIQVPYDEEILHTMGDVNVCVAFRMANGNHLSNENAAFLEDHGVHGFSAINSRHSTIKSFTANKIEEDDYTETFDIEIITSDGSDSNSILRNAVRAIVENANKLLNYL